jgi:molybdenum cofactor cytidylyltransferase
LNKSTIGLLLAAGRGSRFDAAGVHHKLLASVRGEPCIARSLTALKAQVSHTFCVLPSLTSKASSGLEPQVIAQLTRIVLQLGATPIHAPFAHKGMGESLSFAVAFIMGQRGAEVQQATHLLVHLADMPWVKPATFAALTRFAQQSAQGIDSIVLPQYQEQKGNPVIFGRNHWPALRATTGDAGARHLIASAAKQGKVKFMPTKDSAVVRDLDTPDDL